MASTETTERRYRTATRRARPAKDAQPLLKTCRLCGATDMEEIVDAGGDVGLVHRSCFIEWDRRQEALELEMAACVGLLAHPGEYWAELEMEDAPLTRAA
jgi:hypothetical protein